MCGILGIISNEVVTQKSFSKFEYLLTLSETRGKEASGLCVLSSENYDKVNIIKSNLPPSKLIKQKNYKNLKKEIFKKNLNKFVAIGHARMVTDGDENYPNNNQPVETKNLIGIHNGIICNFKDIIKKNLFKKDLELDSEVLFRLVEKINNSKFQNSYLADSVIRSFNEIEGVANVAILNKNYSEIILATNNGSIFCFQNEKSIVFASELLILSQYTKKFNIGDYNKIKKLEPQNLIHINYETNKIFKKNFNENIKIPLINKTNVESKTNNIIKEAKLEKKFNLNLKNYKKFENEFSVFEKKFKKLKRCTSCILTENVPFITFNEKGICSFCQNHSKIQYKDLSLGKKYINDKIKGNPEKLLMALSGGRDSCYGLHHMVKTFQTKPIAYTYDWGMITELGRRNISRMCASLGIEHILITADIKKKRENIKKNLNAWLAKPHVGMVPLFMAGDKHFFYYANKLKKAYNINLDVWCFNPYEITTYKDDYSGIKMWNVSKDYQTYTHEIGLIKKINYAVFYLIQFLKNYKYLNSSLYDTFTGYLSYYFAKKNYFPIFDYIEWDEDKINDTLIKEYNWEVDPCVPTSTWRIGDGTSHFYNYLYFVIGGFSEIDFLRSRQIREGKRKREDVLNNIETENKPNYEGIKWYCEKININFDQTLDRINSIARNYKNI